MAWWNPLDYLGATSDGRSVNDLEAEQRSYQERDAENNRRRYETGYYTAEQFEAAERVRITGIQDVQGEIYQAAGEGAVEGLKELPGTVRGGLNSAFSWSLGFIPWWGWVGALLWLAWYLGGFTYLRGILAKR